MKKKLIALVCALALAVGLVGCSLSTRIRRHHR